MFRPAHQRHAPTDARGEPASPPHAPPDARADPAGVAGGIILTATIGAAEAFTLYVLTKMAER
eukprot:1085-Chlamydomonas_euryale.AAC.1